MIARSKPPLSDPLPRTQEPPTAGRGLLGLVLNAFVSSGPEPQKLPQTSAPEPAPAGGPSCLGERAGSHIVRSSAPFNPIVQKERSKEA